MTVGIYKITNINNNKVYIGSSIDIERRWKEHIHRLKYDAHHSTKLQNSYNRTKNKNIFKFEILEETTEDQIKIREQYYIDLYDAFNSGYNCCKEVDNPKFTTKYIKKINKKKLLEEHYNEFMSLYGQYQDCFKFGYVFMDRLSDKYYCYATYKSVNDIIKWFLNNYNADDYICRFSFNGNRQYFIIISDKDGNEFACYKRYKNKIYNSNYDTLMHQNYLEDKFNPDKHYVVNVPHLKP